MWIDAGREDIELRSNTPLRPFRTATKVHDLGPRTGERKFEKPQYLSRESGNVLDGPPVHALEICMPGLSKKASQLRPFDRRRIWSPGDHSDCLFTSNSSSASSSSLLRAVLMNSSCLAPALNAIAFQPFVVGTVT